MALFVRTLTALLLVACSGGANMDGPDGGALGADARADAGPSYEDGDWLFEKDRVLQVSVQLPASEWDALRNQTRDILDILGEDCGDGPVPKVFTYRSASVTIEGETFAEVGIRKKGFLGSLSTTKPSLKIKMHEYVEGQTMSGVKRFTFNNAKQDPSYLNQCLGYDLFRAAGIPAPRCNFAEVKVNGNNLGLYVHVETVRKPFMGNHFDDDEGNLYEGTLSDFRPEWTSTFEKKTNKSVVESPEIDELVQALSLDGTAMLTALEPLLDVDEFLTFWAMEVLVSHGDGYTGNSNNFYIYEDPSTGKISFLPWGVDNLFNDPVEGPVAVRTRSVLPQKLFAHGPTRSRYVAAMREILDNAWDDAEVLAEITRMHNLIEPLVLAGEKEAFDADITSLRNNITGREAAVRAGLAAITAADGDDLMEQLCFDQAGVLSAIFSTAWGAGGSATLDIDIDGGVVAHSNESSVAVPADDDPNTAVIALFADKPDGGRIVLYLTLGFVDMAPGTYEMNTGYLLFFPPDSDEFERAVFVDGTITLTEASTTNGQPVVGSVQVDLWDSPFF